MVQITCRCYAVNQLELKIVPWHPQLQLVLHMVLPATEGSKTCIEHYIFFVIAFCSTNLNRLDILDTHVGQLW